MGGGRLIPDRLHCLVFTLAALAMIAITGGVVFPAGGASAAEPSLDQVVSGIEKITMNVKDFQAVFINTLTENGVSRVIKLHITFKKPGKFLIEYVQPGASTGAGQSAGGVGSDRAGDRIILSGEDRILIPQGGRPRLLKNLDISMLDLLMYSLRFVASDINKIHNLEYAGSDTILGRKCFVLSMPAGVVPSGSPGSTASGRSGGGTQEKIWVAADDAAILQGEVSGLFGIRAFLKASLPEASPSGAALEPGRKEYSMIALGLDGNRLGTITMTQVARGLWLPTKAIFQTKGGELAQVIQEIKVNTGVKDDLFKVKEIDEMRAKFKEGMSLLEKKRYDKAAEAFERVIELEPAHTLARNNLGLVYMELGRFEDAEKQFKTVIATEPQNAAAYNNLGFMYADSGKDVDGAIRLIEKAISLEPANPVFMDSLGWAYYKKGWLDEATRALKRALLFATELAPDTLSMAHYHLATVYDARNMIQEARSELRKALEADPGNRKAREMLSKINKK
ncbi:MAG TPA: tetratricopeptide repeat protein [Firmicutes bacterium]|nr:tetratricopeptide repeat protein [Bacillota bacterium]